MSFQLRPKPVSTIFDDAFRYYRRSFFPLALISALTQAPLGIFQIAYQPTLNTALSDLMTFSNSSDPSTAQFLHMLQRVPSVVLFFLISAAVTSITQASVMYAIPSLLANTSVHVTRSIALGLRRYISAVALGILAFITQAAIVLFPIICIALLIVLVHPSTKPVARTIMMSISIASLGFVIFCLFVYIRFLLALSVSISENSTPLRSLRRSWALTRRSFWRSAWCALALTVCYLACLLIPANLIGYLFHQQTAAIVVRYLSLLLALPVVSIVSGLFYLDQRVRREGYDLELQMHQNQIA